MKNIPKIAFFYWGAPVVPYLRYMCFKSFRKYNPDWKVILYVPVKLTTTQSWKTFENKQTFNTVDYGDRLEDLGVHVCPFDMESIGFSNDLPEVTKSDIIRLHLLHTIGGLWSDSDILYFRPLGHVLPQTDHTAYFCYRRGGPTQEDIPRNGPKYHSIGFLAGAPGNKYFKRLFETIPQPINMDNYQACGSPFYKTVVADPELAADPFLFNFDVNTVYPSRAVPGMYHGAEYYSTLIQGCTIGWHWYCGHPEAGELQNTMTERTCQQYDNIMSWIIHRVNNNIAV